MADFANILFSGIHGLASLQQAERQRRLDKEAQIDRERGRRAQDISIQGQMQQMGRPVDQAGNIDLPAFAMDSGLQTPGVAPQPIQFPGYNGPADQNRIASWKNADGQTHQVETFTPEEHLQRQLDAARMTAADSFAAAVRLEKEKERIKAETQIAQKEQERKLWGIPRQFPAHPSEYGSAPIKFGPGFLNMPTQEMLTRNILPSEVDDLARGGLMGDQGSHVAAPHMSTGIGYDPVTGQPVPYSIEAAPGTAPVVRPADRQSTRGLTGRTPRNGSGAGSGEVKPKAPPKLNATERVDQFIEKAIDDAAAGGATDFAHVIKNVSDASNYKTLPTSVRINALARLRRMQTENTQRVPSGQADQDGNPITRAVSPLPGAAARQSSSDAARGTAAAAPAETTISTTPGTAPPKPKIYVNPKTKERIYWDGSKWAHAQ